MRTVVGTWVRGWGWYRWTVGVVALVAMVSFHTSLSGKWRMSIELEAGRGTPLLELTEKDGKLTGTYTGRYGASAVEGTVDGRKVTFSVAMQTMSLVFTGELQENGTLAGTADFGEMGEVKWTAAREK